MSRAGAIRNKNVKEVAPKRQREVAKKERTGQLRTLTERDIELRKQADLDLIKARGQEKERYADVRAKTRELSIIEKARLKRLNPTAFASQNAPVFDMTGQKALDTPEELDVKQRKETIKALGRPAASAQPQNFVVEKPLKPNALDIYQSQKIQQRDTVRNQKAFAPVQKL